MTNTDDNNHNQQTCESIPSVSLTTTTSTTTAHRLDPVLMELDAKLAACTEEEDKSQLSGAVAERETRVIGVYRQVK